MLRGELQLSHIELLLKGKITEKEVWTTYATRHHLQIPLNVGKLLAVQYAQIYPENAAVLQLIHSLKQDGVKIGLLSNTVASQAAFNRAHNRYHLFDTIVLSCEIGSKKPEPAIYQKAVEEAGVPAANCVLVDDTEKNLDGAKKMGMQTILFRNGVDSLDYLRDQFALKCLHLDGSIKHKH